GFTGTPIFAQNAPSGGNPRFSTTEQVFGDKLHTYTIVDAINDRNVLPFRIDFINTVKQMDHIDDKRVAAIDRERALAAPERIKLIVEYILEHFDQKTKRAHGYELSSRGDSISQTRVVKGFNSIFAVASIPVAQLYYRELKKQISEQGKDLKIATIYSFSPNEEEPEGILPEEGFDIEYLDQTSRDFLDSAIDDYNKMFATSYSTSSDRFENYYKDLSMRVKNREIDLLLVVNMFLTGFDATTLNTLWVDKQLRQHGLLQAFSRTNRILNSVKTFGNIVCFRDLKEDTDKAISLFGDKDAGGIVLLKTFNEYYYGYEEKGEARPGYVDLVSKITNTYPLGVAILGEQKEKDFIRTYGAILRMRNILTSFDEFEDNEILSERDFQDYQSIYIDLYDKYRVRVEKENINDDLIFELELVRQIEVNIDYILMLVERYAESHKRDKDILLQIDRAIDASIDLRSKKELIERFIEQVNVDTEIDREWREYLNKSKDEDLDVIILDENLKREETRAFMDNAFRDGELRVIGTEIDQI
ncbi:type I restriction endonuclease subunit R, partial [Candidatus Saccharibacteria bacterium]|nr:type I restriction endonuclease subunit R [Candidatus Saccharibacteria bacterium]